MNLRTLLVPAALVAALAVADVPDASAGPLDGVSARTGLAFGPRIYVGGRIGIPLGHGRRHHSGHFRRVVSYTGGHYETRTRNVQVPGQQIGWDFQGRPIYSGTRTEVETYQVWIPRRRIVRRVWVPHRHRHHPRGYIGIGGLVRLH